MKCKLIIFNEIYQRLTDFFECFFFYRFFGPENRVVTLKLIRYTLWMFLIPLATFYIFQNILFCQDQKMLGWSGIAAVIAVNCVIFSYVRMAWNEDSNEEKEARKLGKTMPPKKEYRTD